MLTDNIDYYLEYEGIRMNQKPSPLARVKKIIVLIYGWILLKIHKEKK